MPPVRRTLPLAPLALLALLALAVLAACGTPRARGTHPRAEQPPQVVWTRVTRVADGDTITTRNGWRVRLLQVDTPELHVNECYSREAHRVLRVLLPIGTRVKLESDPALDDVDRYGRRLRYVRRGRALVNLSLVMRGAAAPYLYRGEPGTYATRLLAQARGARDAGRGAWGMCPDATLAPNQAWNTGAYPATDEEPGPPGGSSCAGHPYPCAPPYPPDRDCDEIRRAVWVGSSDPHRIDGDGDGVGCDSYA